MAGAKRIEVADARERERYELSIDGEVVGFTAYRARPGLIAFVHTEVDERLQGRGLADRLIRFALEDARTRRLAVLPFCPFVKAFIERHREFEALVPEAYREQFGLWSAGGAVAENDRAGDERVYRGGRSAGRRDTDDSLLGVGAVSLSRLRADGLSAVREQHRRLDADGRRSGADAHPDNLGDACGPDPDGGGPAGGPARRASRCDR